VGHQQFGQLEVVLVEGVRLPGNRLEHATIAHRDAHHRPVALRDRLGDRVLAGVGNDVGLAGPVGFPGQAVVEREPAGAVLRGTGRDGPGNQPVAVPDEDRGDVELEDPLGGLDHALVELVLGPARDDSGRRLVEPCDPFATLPEGEFRLAATGDVPDRHQGPVDGRLGRGGDDP